MSSERVQVGQGMGEQGPIDLVLSKVALAIRLKTGLGRKEWAGRLDVSREQVRAYEHVGNHTSEKVVQRYAQAAGRPWPKAFYEEIDALAKGKSPAQSDEEGRDSSAPPEPAAASRRRRASAA